MRSDNRADIGLIWAGVIGQACVEVFISMDGAGIAGRFSMEFSVKKSVTRTQCLFRKRTGVDETIHVGTISRIDALHFASRERVDDSQIGQWFRVVEGAKAAALAELGRVGVGEMLDDDEVALHNVHNHIVVENVAVDAGAAEIGSLLHITK